jgi:transposase
MRPVQPLNPMHLQELEQLLKTTQSKGQMQRIQCVLLRACQGMHCEQVAAVVGWSSGWVRQVWSAFLRGGPQALLDKPRGGRLRANLSREQENALIKQFEENARAGNILVVSEIHEAYEKTVGHPVPKSTIYRLLSRHGWRKVAPRPCHPKNDPTACAAFKKNSQTSLHASENDKLRKGDACA